MSYLSEKFTAAKGVTAAAALSLATAVSGCVTTVAQPEYSYSEQCYGQSRGGIDTRSGHSITPPVVGADCTYQTRRESRPRPESKIIENVTNQAVQQLQYQLNYEASTMIRDLF